ncbi:MAG: hypothetical protein RIC95_12715 [Vicingaceae bacterium]
MSAQVIEEESVVQYYRGFPFQEGIYTSFQEFIENKPKIQSNFERRGDQLFVYEDSSERFIRVNPNRVWGYSQAGNVYISQEETYWRLINIGALSHFTAIAITTIQTVDNFGFPMTQQSKSLQQLFLDFETGKVKALKYQYLKPYIERDPLLDKRFHRLKKKDRELILALKAYNELHPIYFPTP